jgi:hypothetical protein
VECDWTDCSAPAVHRLPIQPGLELRVDGSLWRGDEFATCETHAPRIAALALEAIDEALRRHAARTNFAPGDAEWDETFDRDRDRE